MSLAEPTLRAKQLKGRAPRRQIKINGMRKLHSHVVWHAATDHWPIFPDEVIHHIDGDTFNDEFSNLILMSRSEHQSVHNSGKNNYWYGKTRSDTFKAERSVAMTGENNPRWLGDAAKSRSKYQRERRRLKRLNNKTELRRGSL